MRVLFLYPNENMQPALQVGIASLASAVKALGHSVELFDTTFLAPLKVDALFRQKLAAFAPDLLAVSCRSLEWETVRRLLKLVPESVFVAVGGAHPTVAPHLVMEEPRVNAAVLGEGEGAIVDLVQVLSADGDVSGIENLWVRKDEKVVENPLRPLIADLDTLPMPDWNIFDPQHLTNIVSTKKGSRALKRGSFETSRGCPYHCAYCINAHMQKLYKGKGTYHREKSIDRAIGEIVDYRKRYCFDWVYFIDETLIAKKQRAQEFFTAYKRQVGLPFSLMVQPTRADAESLRLAADAGAQVALIGIESGDEEFRSRALARRVSDEQVVAAFKNARDAGLATYSFNIVGFPGETREMIGKTIELNRRAKPDVVQVTIFYPFPGTQLFEDCVEAGYLPAEGRKVANYYAESVLEMPTLSKEQIRRAAKVFPFYVKWPQSRHWVLKKAEKNDTWFALIRMLSLLSVLRAGIGFALGNIRRPAYLMRRIGHFLFGS